MTLAVIIPVLRDDAALRGLLDALDAVRTGPIVIADGEGRAAPPFDLPAQAVWLPTGPGPGLGTDAREPLPGRGPQIALALDHVARAAAADHIWVLHADSRPHPDSAADIARLLGDPNTALGRFSLRFDAPGLALRLFERLARLDTPLSVFGDQGLFFRLRDYQRADIVLADFPLMEDVALVRALRRLGRVRRSPLPIATSARRFLTLGPWRTQFVNLRLLLAFWRGADPRALYRAYGYGSESEQKSPAGQAGL